MNFKLKNIVSNVSDTTTDADRTHTLTFMATDSQPIGVMVFGQSTVVLSLTAAEAAAYVMGKDYTLALNALE